MTARHASRREPLGGGQPQAGGTISPIAERQNAPDALKLLRAYTWHYRVAKRWHFLRVLGTLTLAAAAPVITFHFPGAAGEVAAIAGGWVLLGRTLLIWVEQRQSRLAANIQEQFDVDLFQLVWNEGLVGKRVAEEDIIDAARHVEDDTKLRDWYAPTAHAPKPLDVLLCQRSSAVWGRRTHFGYAVVVGTIAGGWFLAGIGMGLIAHVSLAGYLIKLFLPSQPALLDSIELVRNHLRQSARKRELEELADSLWEAGCRTPTGVTSQDCRDLQDQSYRLRLDGPGVAQWYYTVRRTRDQRVMAAAVEALLEKLPQSESS
jgi:hypothetical protein